jgi:simple sugar transport system permease protein
MTPLLFASMACLIFTKGGIDSIATEGIMLMCALAGAVGAWLFKSAWGGLLFGMATGILLSFVFGYVTLTLRANPVLAGIALNILAGGLTIFIIYYLTGEKGSTQSLATPVLPNIDIPGLAAIPFLGKIFSGHNVLTYVSLLSVAFLHFFLYKTVSGLRMRTVGENPAAAASVGLSVMKYKYMSLFIAGALAGLGGAFMSLGYVSMVSKNMVAGRGFIGMAAESMGQGVPGGVLLATLLFSVADALSVRLQLMSLPPELIQLLPYLVTIVAIAVYSHHREKKKERRD